MRLTGTLLALTIATAICPVAATAQMAAAPTLIDGTVLELVSEGKAERNPNLVTVNAGVVTQAPTAAEALSANASRVRRVVTSLKASGLEDRDLRTAQISLQPQYIYAENKAPVITGYQASNSISVRFRDVARAGSILDLLVREGANQIDGPTFLTDNPEVALDEARTDALAKARERAALYSRLSGLNVDRILSISESPVTNVPMITTRAYAGAEAAADSTKLMPGVQEVTTNLVVRFLLK
ncbi:SIMPL domain-containing protein [Sphingopyxis terrae]|uniref:SIMPL domain-containing protein n=1 Tax=Sphingopyxis terrae TaxID=33052 RepID=UPI0007892D0D|nr:SIMPL domain-containing protein [Sphingopyxis terrae]